MRVEAGKRDRLIVIERATFTTDAMGGRIETWHQYARAWAQVIFGTGAERREAAQQIASVSATFRIVSSPTLATVTPQHRIQFMGAVWDISSVVPLGRANIEITATRAA